MARGKKRGPTLMDKRREADAVEAREGSEPEAKEEEEVEAVDDEGDSDDGDEDAPKKKKAAKKAKVPAVKKPTVKRVRVPKEVRHKAVWVVFDNASKRIDSFPFNQKADAEALLAKKIEEKKGTFYINLIKDPLD